MRKVTLEEIEGLWRCDNLHSRLHLYIRQNLNSRFTQFDLKSNSILNEVNGQINIIENFEADNYSLWFDEKFELTIWHLALETNSIIFEIKGIGRYSFIKIG